MCRVDSQEFYVGACEKHRIAEHKKELLLQELSQARLAKFYARENLGTYEKWHGKLGHIGGKALRKCQIQGLVIPKNPFRCDACIRGKMHRMGHSPHSTGSWEIYKPGEYILTDLQGPYIRSLGGHRYSQIFLDVGSRKIWTIRLASKTESNKAIKSVG